MHPRSGTVMRFTTIASSTMPHSLWHCFVSELAKWKCRTEKCRRGEKAGKRSWRKNTSPEEWILEIKPLLSNLAHQQKWGFLQDLVRLLCFASLSFSDQMGWFSSEVSVGLDTFHTQLLYSTKRTGCLFWCKGVLILCSQTFHFLLVLSVFAGFKPLSKDYQRW